jgi:GntR family transcriptional regulator
MIELDIRSRQPIYEQLVEKIKRLIMTGVMKSDEQFPSVRQLATQLTINPNTIQKAYRELEQQGYIYSLPGKGSFVSALRDQGNQEKLNVLCLDIKRILAEALYLGLDQQTLMGMFEEVKETLSGGTEND